MKKLEPLQLTISPFSLRYAANHAQRADGYDHYHQGLELLFIHEGCGTVFTNGRLYEMAAGQLYFFQPFQFHRVFAAANRTYRRTVIKFEPSFLLPYLQPFAALSHFLGDLCKGTAAVHYIELSEHETRLLAALSVLQHQSGMNQANLDSFAALMTGFLEALRLSHGSRLFPSHDHQQITPYYTEAVIQWIEDHLQEKFQLDELAQSLHLSKNHISRRFKAETGSSIQDCLISRRIRRACQLLHTTSLPIEHIAAEAGFSNSSYFCKLFKRHLGLPPLQYRRKAALPTLLPDV